MVRTAIFTAAAICLLSGCATTGEGTSTTTTTPSAPTASAPSTPAPAASGGTASNVNAQGAAILQRSCTTCHDEATITGERKTSAGWRATIDDMVSRGAILSDSDANTLQAYLTATHGAS